jgi:hypothetical protein
MSSFINSSLLKPTLPIEKYDSKVVVSKNDVNLQFLLARDIGKTYKVVYIVNIIPRQKIDPMVPLSPKIIDMDSLKKSIIDNTY